MAGTTKHPVDTVKRTRRTAVENGASQKSEPLPDLYPAVERTRPIPRMRFPERIRITKPGEPGSTELYAIGRAFALWPGIVVEVERDGQFLCNALLGGFDVHAPSVFARLDFPVVDALPPFEPPTG